MRKVGGEHPFCVLIYMNSYIFHICFISFILFSYLIFDFVCLTLSSADTHGIAKYACTYILDTHTHARTHTHKKSRKIRKKKKIVEKTKKRGGIRKERKKEKRKDEKKRGEKKEKNERKRGGGKKKWKKQKRGEWV